MTTERNANSSKAIAARRATTQGLFARDVVQPKLGEDPQGYEVLHLELTIEINPANLLERHYAEKIAAASWRLRRLHRWQAQILEDATLTEDARILKLDRVLRQETTLQRQIDSSVKMLTHEVPHLMEGRARRAALAELGATERECRHDSRTDAQVAERTRENLSFAQFSPDHRRFDNTSGESQHGQHEICENEPAPATPSSPCSEGEVARNEPEGVLGGVGLQLAQRLEAVHRRLHLGG